MVSMLYLGDGKRQTGVVWAKTACIGTLKARYVQKKLQSWGFKIISSNIINLHCLKKYIPSVFKLAPSKIQDSGRYSCFQSQGAHEKIDLKTALITRQVFRC
jgi:hypothetical protein